MFLTKSGGFIVKPLAILLGKLMSWIYDIFSGMGIEGIAVTIIISTALVRLLMIPMMIKQNKSSKITAYIQPEINKIAKKYKGKKDQDSMLAQNREVRAIQDEYGANMTTGCLLSILQFPVFIAFYRVIQNIPAYVDKIKDIYTPISDAIFNSPDAYKVLETYQQADKTLSAVKMTAENPNTIIDVLAKIPTGQWGDLAAKFADAGMTDISNSISAASGKLAHIYDLFGAIDLTTAPGFKLTIALLIPILSMVFQFLSMKATPQQSATDPTQEQSMKMMKSMLYAMPIMSLFITINVPAGVGLYWATGSLFSLLTTIGINIYFKYCDMDAFVEKAKAKAAKKNAKRKAKGKKSWLERMQEAQAGQSSEGSTSRYSSNTLANKSLKSYTSERANTADTNAQFRKGSLASKANIMQRYNDNNNGGK